MKSKSLSLLLFSWNNTFGGYELEWKSKNLRTEKSCKIGIPSRGCLSFRICPSKLFVFYLLYLLPEDVILLTVDSL